MKHALRNRSSHGFTIIEIVVTISLIGLLLPPIVVFINSIVSLNARANTLSFINAYAENKIESYRSAGFNGVPITSGNIEYTGAQALPSSVPKPNSATYNVALADASNTSVKKITLTITFRAPSGTETHHYVTYLGELGVGQY